METPHGWEQYAGQKAALTPEHRHVVRQFIGIHLSRCMSARDRLAKSLVRCEDKQARGMWNYYRNAVAFLRYMLDKADDRVLRKELMLITVALNDNVNGVTILPLSEVPVAPELEEHVPNIAISGTPTVNRKRTR